MNSGATYLAITGSADFAGPVCGLTDVGEINCLYESEVERNVLELPESFAAPENLSVARYSETLVELSWEIPSQAPFILNGAEIYRDGDLLAVTTNRTSYLDNTVVAGVMPT